MVPVCSAANGSDDAAKMRAGISYAFNMILLCSIFFMIFMIVLADPLMSIMTQEPSMHELHGTFVWTLKVSALLLPFIAMMGIGSSILQSLKRSQISMRYYMLWAIVKLGLYAVACMYSFEAIIYSMVLVHTFGGISLMILANKEFKKRFPGERMLNLRPAKR